MPTALRIPQRKPFCPLAVRIKLEDTARFSSAALSDTFRARAIDTYIFLPSGEKTMHRVPVSAARTNLRARDVPRVAGPGPRALRSPLTIWKSNHAISIRDGTKTPGRRRVDQKRSRTFCSGLCAKISSDVGLPSPLGIAQHLDLIGATLYTKMSPFGALSRNRGSRNPVAYNSILNPGGTLVRFSWPVYDTRPINREDIRTWHRQILTVFLRVTPAHRLSNHPLRLCR